MKRLIIGLIVISHSASVLSAVHNRNLITANYKYVAQTQMQIRQLSTAAKEINNAGSTAIRGNVNGVVAADKNQSQILLLNQAARKMLEKAKTRGNQEMPNGSGTDSGGGMAGPPRGNWGVDMPGEGNNAPPFVDEDDGLSGITDPAGGMGGKGKNIQIPGKYTPIGSYGNLYGGVNPARDPRMGGGVADKTGSTGGSKDYEANPQPMKKNEAELVFGVSSGCDYYEVDQYGPSNNRTTLLVGYHTLNNKIIAREVWVISGDRAIYAGFTEMNRTTDDYDGKGSRRNGLTPEERRRVEKIISQQVLDDIENGPVISNDGGVVDPVRNQASMDANTGSVSNGSVHGKAPQASKNPGSFKPGSQLTGPGRIDVDKGKYIPQLPKGFHVVDPATKSAKIK